jgi:hypothetical protein
MVVQSLLNGPDSQEARRSVIDEEKGMNAEKVAKLKRRILKMVRDS